MKIFFIFMMISVFISIFYLIFYCYNLNIIIKSFKKNIKAFRIIVHIIFPLSALVSILTFIILVFYLNWILGLLLLVIYGLLSLLFIEEEVAWTYPFLWLIVTLFCFWTIPIKKIPQNITQDVRYINCVPLYNSSNNSNNQTVVVNILDANDDNTNYYLYTIMEYNPEDITNAENIKIPSTIKYLENLRITKDDENKLEIITKVNYSYTVLSYFEVWEPDINFDTSYSLCINESNVISSSSKPD